MGKGSIISFAWTTSKVRDRTKRVTRRYWSDDYAKRFKPGRICQAYTKVVFHGGKKICDIRVVSCERQPLEQMTEEDFILEGGYDLWPGGLPEFRLLMRKPNVDPFRLEFEYVD